MMQNAQQPEQIVVAALGGPALREADLRRVAEFIGDEVGIQLPASKRTMVEGRLRKRLRTLGFNDFPSYLDFTLKTPDGEYEKLHLIDSLTTNKTDFFREPEHFTYLIKNALPILEQMRRKAGRMEINVWSAGCSSGEEPYTLSIVLNEATNAMQGLRYKILATDISSTVLKKAKSGVYTEARIEPVPTSLRKKYFLRSSDPKNQVVMMGPELKQNIRFGSLNLMSRSFPIQEKMDAIFCRNVMIYFNNQIREELVNRFEKQLIPGGYLFIGHSESLGGLKTQLEQVAPMVYQKPME